MLDFGLYFTLAVVALALHLSAAAAVGKKQIKWIYLGLALGFLPFLAIYIVPYLVIGSVAPIYTTLSILPLALIPLAFAVSILKYKLWDVEVVIKEVLAYSVTFAFGMIAFSTVNLVLSHVIEERSAHGAELPRLQLGTAHRRRADPGEREDRVGDRDDPVPRELPPSPDDDRLRAGAGHVPRRATS